MTDIYAPTLVALAKKPLVPVLTLKDVDSAKALAEKLNADGFTVIEATLRTEAALPAMRAMKQTVPDLLVGMGTILTSDDIQASLDAGADFLVTPATTPKLISELQKVQVPVFPGIATPSEALHLFEQGFPYLKFFPAEANGGVKALKSWSDPMSKLKFMPTGGIKESNYQDYLDLPNVIAVGGSWMAK